MNLNKANTEQATRRIKKYKVITLGDQPEQHKGGKENILEMLSVRFVWLPESALLLSWLFAGNVVSVGMARRR